MTVHNIVLLGTLSSRYYTVQYYFMAAKKPISTSRNPAGRPKDSNKKRAILDAAEPLFIQQGYELTSMDAISKLAGVSKLTLYSHFAHKDDLFKAVIQRKCEQYNMPSTFMQLTGVPLEKALTLIATNFLNLIYSNEAIRMHRIIEAEAVRHPKLAELFYQAGPQQVKAAFRELLAAWVKQKKLHIPEVDRACDHFFSLLKGECHFHMLLGLQKAPNKKEKDLHIASCLRVFLKAYT